jgi:hypothetical protein
MPDAGRPESSEGAGVMYKDKIIEAARAVVKDPVREADYYLIPGLEIAALRDAIKAYDDWRATLNSTPITGGWMMDIMDAILAGVKKRDHMIVRAPIGEEISDAILDEMAADGFVFACAPAAPDGQGYREFYFQRVEPVSRLTT